MDTSLKHARLKIILQEIGSALIAFSGGVDSTFLAAVAVEVLGAEMVLLVFASSGLVTPEESLEAEKLAELLKAGFLKIETDIMSCEQFVSNPVDRCYYCRENLARKLKIIAGEKGLLHIIDGNNYDDLSDHRPGWLALKEHGIRSPLCEAELTKDEIRLLSRRIGLPGWDRAPSPCLATRIPCGVPITPQLVSRIAEGERYLRKKGLRQLRLRHHGDVARIETDEEGMKMLLSQSLRVEAAGYLSSLGYTYITLDIRGYRGGSINKRAEGARDAGT